MNITAPLELHRATVLPEYIDFNGHMNVAYYVLMFDHATDDFFDWLGMDEEFRTRNGYTTFTLECSVTYQREVMEGDEVRITTQLLDYNPKLLHYFHHMYHAEEGYLAATNELLTVHIDFNTRRSTPFPEEHLALFEKVRAAHAALPRPAEAGRPMGIRKR